MRGDNRWWAVALAATMMAGPGAVLADDSYDTGSKADDAEEAEVTSPEPSSKSAGGIDQESTGSVDEGAEMDTGSTAESGTGAEATSGTGASEAEVTNPEPPSSESAGGIDPGAEDPEEEKDSSSDVQ